MALKADRHELQTDISFFMNEVATRGGVASLDASVLGNLNGVGSSGAAMDQSQALVKYVATRSAASAGSGIVPVGILLNDMVNLDLTRQHINWHKDEVQKGGKVTLLKKGWVVTDKIYPGHSPKAGDIAFVGHSGLIGVSMTIADQSDLSGEGFVVGRFMSKKDEDGYAKVEVNLPNNNNPADQA
jgi:hypothetical protein